jgi:outer membrane protein
MYYRMQIKYLKITFCVLVLCAPKVIAQDAWSLEKCIQYAFENNISIKRQEIAVGIEEKNLNQSKRNKLPNLNAESNYGLNLGYTWLQQEGRNVDSDLHAFDMYVGGYLPVFEGFRIGKSIKQKEYDLLGGVALKEKLENDISIQIAVLYHQILFDKELLRVAEDQYKVTRLQAEQTKKLVDAGSQAMGSYLEIKSQAAKEALHVTQQKNKLFMSLLNLAQLLDLEDVSDFDIVSPEIPQVGNMELKNPLEIYQVAVTVMPQIKRSDYLLESKQYEVELAKSSFYPSVRLQYQWRSRANWLVEDVNSTNRNLSDQIKSNGNWYVGASIRIPIFNRMQSQTNVQKAKNNVQDARYSLDQEKLHLRKEIQQAYADAVAAFNKYVASNEAVESYKESFRYTEQKFNVGMVNSVDYTVAKTDFAKAQSDLLQAKYEYLLRNKILDFYNGIPISL